MKPAAAAVRPRVDESHCNSVAHPPHASSLAALRCAHRHRDPGAGSGAEDTLSRQRETERLRAALISFYLMQRCRDPAAAAKAAEHSAIQVRLYPRSSVLSDRFGTPEPHPLIEAEWRRHLSAGLTDAAASATPLSISVSSILNSPAAPFGRRFARSRRHRLRQSISSPAGGSGTLRREITWMP